MNECNTYRNTGFYTKWIPSNPFVNDTNRIHIVEGTLSIQNNNNEFDISFTCTSSEGKTVEGRYKGTPDFWSMIKSYRYNKKINNKLLKN